MSHDNEKNDSNTRPPGEERPAGSRDDAVAWFLAEMARAPDLDPEDLTGQTLAGFELTKRLPRSTFGSMYEAKNPDGVLVAVRVVSPSSVADPAQRTQLLATAKQAATIKHPNLASVCFADAVEGQVVVASELVDGLRLSERLSRVHLPALPEVRTIARGVARGLRAAHDAGLVHLDVEPANVMLTHTSGVKLMDLGLGQAAGAMYRGAPGYASPEQTRGHAGDPRSDVFSFGALLYEMLTGEGPFESDTPESTTVRMMAARRARLEEVRPDVPADLRDVVARCLQVKPQERYADASELVTALEAVAPDPMAAPAPAPPAKAASPAVETAEPQVEVEPPAADPPVAAPSAAPSSGVATSAAPIEPAASLVWQALLPLLALLALLATAIATTWLTHTQP